MLRHNLYFFFQKYVYIEYKITLFSCLKTVIWVICVRAGYSYWCNDKDNGNVLCFCTLTTVTLLQRLVIFTHAPISLSIHYLLSLIPKKKKKKVNTYFFFLHSNLLRSLDKFQSKEHLITNNKVDMTPINKLHQILYINLNILEH